LKNTRPIQIALHARLSDAGRTLAIRYLLMPRSLLPEERLRALEVFDELGASTITVRGQTKTFAAFYRTEIEDKYAASFLHQLLTAHSPEATGHQLLRDAWQHIVNALRTMDVQLVGDIEQQCLVTFCGYWWGSLGKGYIQEVVVFRDLEHSGIEFVAHDLRRRNERFSPYDLTVLGFHGDVKTSTYFLHAARSYPLMNDFYLVRIYNVVRRVWPDIAMLKPTVWRVLDGDTMPCELDDVASLLPTPLQLIARDEVLIVITYAEWKQRVLRVQ